MTDKLQALIFDVDGTLAETEELHRHAFNAAFAGAGLDWHWDQAAYAGLLEVTGGKERIARHMEALPTTLGAEAVRQLHAAKTAHYVAAVDAGTVALRPGVRRLLVEARAAGLRLAIATTTSPANVGALLRATLGAEGPAMFEVIGAGDVVPRKKPASDIYQWVLDRLGLPAACCVAFEDTPNGLRSALGVGIPTVVTTSLYGGTAGFENAVLVVDGLGDPGAPCRVLHGPALPGPVLDLAGLQSVLRAANGSASAPSPSGRGQG